MEYKNIRYSEYCTCFLASDNLSAVFWDELPGTSGRQIKSVRCDSKEEAIKLMDEWVANAPAGVTCQKIWEG